MKRTVSSVFRSDFAQQRTSSTPTPKRGHDSRDGHPQRAGRSRRRRLQNSREEKGRFVYDQLRSVALKTQGPLVDFLTSKGVDFQRFYITNMISLYNAILLNEIAARPEVARVINNPR